MSSKMDTDLSFDGMWTQAETRFLKITNKNLRAAPKRSLDDVVKDLEARYSDKDSDDESAKSRAKEWIGNVLNCINLLGGIAAQGASMVFGPATLCYSAVSFLIEIPTKVGKLYEGLAELFEEIATFLKQFKIYKRIEQFTNIDPELKRTTHGLMISFVDICALSINVLGGSKWKQIKAVAKVVLFDNDSGVKGELEKFRRLVDQQSRISDAVTLEHVLLSHTDLSGEMKKIADLLNGWAQQSGRISDGVDFLVEEANERKMEKVATEQIKRLSEFLSISAEVANASEKTFQKLSTDGVEESGSWIQEIDEYKAWTDLDSNSDALLLLSGREKSGKSYLISAIVQELKSRQRESVNMPARMSIAYYYFPERDDKVEKAGALQDSQLRNPATALKSMAIQIAKQNASYAKEMDRFWEGKKEPYLRDISYKNLCNDLQLFAPKKDAAHILLLDGLEQLSDNTTRQLFEVLLDAKQPKVRIIASATADVLEKCMSSFGNALLERTVPRIQIEDLNERDIKQYVERELRRNDLLQDTETETVQLKTSIRDDLPKLAQGNFSRAQRVLDRIKEAISADHSAEDIQKLLQDDSFDDGSAAAKKVIGTLNSSLNAQEIDQISELLNWGVHGYRYFDVDQLKAVLFLRYNRTPLQPLEKKLTGKYAKVFTIDSDGDVVVDDDIETLFKESPSSRLRKSVEEKDRPQISMAITINQADVEMVRRFFWDLGENAVFHKFNFDDFKDSGWHMKISANPVDAHFAMTKQCMKLLLSEPDERTNCLIAYALEELPSHLQTLRGYADSGDLDSSEKKEVVQSLVSLLLETDSIEKHWNSQKYRDEWFDGIDTFRRWLDDQEVTGSLVPLYRLWVERSLKSTNPGVMCLKDITRMVAKRWLRDAERRDVSAHCAWVDRFISEQSNPASKDDKHEDGHDDSKSDGSVSDTDDEDQDEDEEEDDEEDTPEDILDKSNILRAIEWAETELGIKEKDSLWFQRIGETFLHSRVTDQAKQAFQQARSLPDAKWKSSEGLALAYEMEDNFQSAIEQMEAVVKELRDRAELKEEDRTDFVEDLSRLATWQLKLQPPQTWNAISLYQEILQHDPNHYKTCWKLLELFADAGRFDEGSSLLKTMSDQSGKDGDLTRLGEMLLSFDFDLPLETFDLVFQVTRKGEMFKEVLNTLEQVIKVARKRQRSSVLGPLLLVYGVALAHYNEGEKRPDLALPCWEECYSLGLKMGWGSIGYFTVTLASKYASTYYLAQAISQHTAGSDPEAHVSKLIELSSQAHDIYAVEYHLRSVLASYYTLLGEQAKAKQHLLNHMKTAMDLLSDDDPDNDYQGYKAIADVLIHVGDDVNALSAWSLLGPDDPEDDKPADGEESKPAQSDEQSDKPIPQENTPAQKQPRRGKLGYVCDGRCGKTWTYSDDIWCCKMCPDVQFDGRCLEKLRNGTLKRYICSPDHKWLHVPPWSDEEYREVRKDRVRIGGELVDGKRVGGQVVSVEEWLNALRDTWGIPREVKNDKQGGEETEGKEETERGEETEDGEQTGGEI